MTGSTITDVTPDTLHFLEEALSRLSEDLGDTHRSGVGALRNALFGPAPACHGALAVGQDNSVLGGVLFSPVMSTTVGAAGIYVSDLWVADTMRGQALGPQLLAHAAGRAQKMWSARFIRLVSYGSNHRARAFYARLGFGEKHDETVLQISGDAFDQLMG